MPLNPSHIPRLVYDYLRQIGFLSLADSFATECPYLTGLKFFAETAGNNVLPAMVGPSLVDIVHEYFNAKHRMFDINSVNNPETSGNYGSQEAAINPQKDSSGEEEKDPDISIVYCTKDDMSQISSIPATNVQSQEWESVRKQSNQEKTTHFTVNKSLAVDPDLAFLHQSTSSSPPLLLDSKSELDLVKSQKLVHTTERTGGGVNHARTEEENWRDTQNSTCVPTPGTQFEIGNAAFSINSPPEFCATKCHQLLSYLLLRVSNHPRLTNISRILIQNLIDGKIDAEVFVRSAQQVIIRAQSPNTPLIPFLKNSLPHLRRAMAAGTLTLNGIRPPGVPIIVHTNAATNCVVSQSPVASQRIVPLPDEPAGRSTWQIAPQTSELSQVLEQTPAVPSIPQVNTADKPEEVHEILQWLLQPVHIPQPRAHSRANSTGSTNATLPSTSVQSSQQSARWSGTSKPPVVSSCVALPNTSTWASQLPTASSAATTVALNLSAVIGNPIQPLQLPVVSPSITQPSAVSSSATLPNTAMPSSQPPSGSLGLTEALAGSSAVALLNTSARALLPTRSSGVTPAAPLLAALISSPIQPLQLPVVSPSTSQSPAVSSSVSLTSTSTTSRQTSQLPAGSPGVTQPPTGSSAVGLLNTSTRTSQLPIKPFVVNPVAPNLAALVDNPIQPLQLPVVSPSTTQPSAVSQPPSGLPAMKQLPVAASSVTSSNPKNPKPSPVQQPTSVDVPVVSKQSPSVQPCKSDPATPTTLPTSKTPMTVVYRWSWESMQLTDQNPNFDGSTGSEQNASTQEQSQLVHVESPRPLCEEASSDSYPPSSIEPVEKNSKLVSLSVEIGQPTIKSKNKSDLLKETTTAATQASESNVTAATNRTEKDIALEDAHMTPQEAEAFNRAKKCSKLLARWLKYVNEKCSESVARHVRMSTQALIDLKIDPETFAKKIKPVFNPSPPPRFFSLIKENLHCLREALADKALTLENIKPPTISSNDVIRYCQKTDSSQSLRPQQPDAAPEADIPLSSTAQTSSLRAARFASETETIPNSSELVIQSVPAKDEDRASASGATTPPTTLHEDISIKVEPCTDDFAKPSRSSPNKSKQQGTRSLNSKRKRSDTGKIEPRSVRQRVTEPSNPIVRPCSVILRPAFMWHSPKGPVQISR